MLSYIGGKSKIGKWIVPFYDKDMETYLETFGGMFWCFFNMNLKEFPNLNKVVYNDFNPLNYNLFKCAQNPNELLKAINSIDCQKFGVEQTPEIYRNQFVSFQSELFTKDITIPEYDYETAAKYVYILTQVFSGSKPETMAALKGKSGESLKQMLGNKSLMQTISRSSQLVSEIVAAEDGHRDALEGMAADMVTQAYPIIDYANIRIEAEIVGMGDMNIGSGEDETPSEDVNTPEAVLAKRRIINGITQGASIRGAFAFYLFREYLDVLDDTLVDKYADVDEWFSHHPDKVVNVSSNLTISI